MAVRAATKQLAGKTASSLVDRFLRKGAQSEEEEPPQRPSIGTQIFGLGKKEETEDDAAPSQGSPSVGLQLAVPFGLPVLGRGRFTDAKTVFVANATGQTGSRIALALLRQGFKVRAGVSDLQQAQQLAEVSAAYGLISEDEARRLNVVEFNVSDEQLTARAIGNAGKLVVTLGSDEAGPQGRVGPTEAARVVEAAALAKVPNVVFVAEGGGSGPVAAATGGGLRSIFAQLFSAFKGGAGGGGAITSLQGILDRLADSEVNYTVIKTAPSASVPDTYAANVVVSPEGSAAASGQISRLQVGQVVASVFSNVGVAENKVFQVTTSAGAPARSIEELLSAISIDNRRANLGEARARAAEREREMKEKAEADGRDRRKRADAQAEAARAADEARAAQETSAALEAEARQLEVQEARAAEAAARAKERAQAAATSVSGLASRVKEAGAPGFVAPQLPSLSSGSVGGGLGSLFRRKAKEAEGAVAQVADKAAAPAKGGGFGWGPFAPKPPLKEEVVEKVERAAPKLSLPSLNLGALAPKGKPAAPKPRGKAAPEKRKAPPPAPKAKPPPPPASKEEKGKGGLGGLFGGGDSVYIDSSSAGDF